MTFRVIRWVCIIIISCFSVVLLNAQADSIATQNGLTANFVKYQRTHKLGTGFYFNSVHIKNVSSEEITLKPKITVPEGWQIPKFVLIPKSIKLAPNASKYIPIKILVPNDAVGDAWYTLHASFSNDEGRELMQAHAKVYVPEKRDWEMKVLEKEVILLPADSNMVRFETKFQNLGNTREIITLQLQMEDVVENTTIILPPGEDTIVTFSRTYKETRITEGATKEYVELFAQSTEEEEYADVSFMKFKNKFNGNNAKIRQNYIEVGYNNLFSLGRPRLNLSTGGAMRLGRSRSVAYNLDYADLASIQELINFPILTFSYFGDNFDYQVGNVLTLGQIYHDVSTMEGRTPENNGYNSLGVTYKYRHNLSHRTEVSAARNIRNPITNVAVGHTYRIENVALQGVGSYTLDFLGRKSTRIASINTEIPLFKHHYINFIANLANEKHHLESTGRGNEDLSHLGTETFGQNSHNYRLFYDGQYFKNLRIILFHSFTSNAYPNRSRGTNITTAQARYLFPESNHEFRAFYRKFALPDLIFDNGIAFEQTPTSREEYTLSYFLPINKTTSINGGGYLQEFNAANKSAISGEIFPFQSNSWNVFVSSTARVQNSMIILRGIYGTSTVEDFIDAQNGQLFENVNGFRSINVSLNFYSNGFNLGMLYLKGINSLLTNYRPGMDDLTRETFTAYFNWDKYLLKRRLFLRLNTVYRQDIQRKRTTFTVIPQVQYNLKFGWSAYIRGNYNYIIQQGTNGVRGVFLPQVNTGIRKEFDLLLETKSHNLTVFCYLDENNNNRYDDGEKGIQDIQVEAKPQAIGKKRKTNFDDVRYPVVTLFSNKTGKMFFKKIARGTHLIEIRKIAASSNHYILKADNTQSLELNEDKTMYIPFAKARIIKGKAIIKREKFSKKIISSSGIRVTATDKNGKKYYALTGKDGSYELALPAGEYNVIINNPLGKDVQLMNNINYANLDENTEVTIDFTFRQKQRKINFNK